MWTKRFVLACIALLTIAGAALADPVGIDWVTVGNPGNAADTRYESPGYGAVAYSYRIGKYEITNAQYTAFLNAVAATDTYRSEEHTSELQSLS
jgi:formylglycine-generating enzyme required for sulfatase activity